jgi:hypothetical protein
MLVECQYPSIREQVALPAIRRSLCKAASHCAASYHLHRGSSVTFWTKVKKLRRRIEVQYSLEDFIDHWAQHIPERYQHAVRSFGLFAPRALRQTSAALFAILGQERRPRPKPRPWADSIKRDFGRDPLLDHSGKRMKWEQWLAPKAPHQSELSGKCHDLT